MLLLFGLSLFQHHRMWLRGVQIFAALIRIDEDTAKHVAIAGYRAGANGRDWEMLRGTLHSRIVTIHMAHITAARFVGRVVLCRGQSIPKDWTHTLEICTASG